MSFLDASGYWWARFCVQRGLGLVYLVAFLVAARQFRPLLGERGLLPVPAFLGRVRFRKAPSLFWLRPTDGAFATAAWAGCGLSLVAASGLADAFGFGLSMAVWGALWILYLSFVNVGQIFYGYGWESLLLETGFLAVFLGPLTSVPALPVVWALRWVLFRLMFGAGLIKMRGDPCWRDLTCLFYHHETQPLPNPLSWRMHHLPRSLLRAGVFFTHAVQLVVPFGLLAPPPISTVAGLATAAFQLTLILSGNLSWLNHLSLVLVFSCFDDRFLGAILPVGRPASLTPRPLPIDLLLLALSLLIAVRSVEPVRNLLSRTQAMNASFDPLHLVNTYGAFGSVTRERREIVFEASLEAPGSETVWREYAFKGKPGDPAHRPPLVAPYHLRLDWQMWFAAMGPPTREPWIVTFATRLLAADPATLRLLAASPCGEEAPRRLRALLYRYRFTTPAERRETGDWWSRELLGTYLPELTLQQPAVRRHLGESGRRAAPTGRRAPR